MENIFNVSFPAFCKYEHYKCIFALKIAVHNVGSTIMETGIMKKVNALFMIMDTFGGDETDYPIVSHSCNCADTFPHMD